MEVGWRGRSLSAPPFQHAVKTRELLLLVLRRAPSARFVGTCLSPPSDAMCSLQGDVTIGCEVGDGHPVRRSRTLTHVLHPAQGTVPP